MDTPGIITTITASAIPNRKNKTLETPKNTGKIGLAKTLKPGVICSHGN